MIEFKNFEESKKTPGIDITPMLDMIFILLIFFLLTASVTRLSVAVDLPKVDAGVQTKDETIVISILKDGSLAIDKKEIDRKKLIFLLENNYPAKNVFIEADKSIAFGFVLSVMDDCKKCGMETVSFIVEQKTSQDKE